MARGFTWHLEIIDWNAIKRGDYGGDICCNTSIEWFWTLSDVWDYIGGRLKKERCGYAGIRNGIEYRLTRLA